MSLLTALVVVSVVAALILLLEGQSRILPGVALLVTGIELLMRLQIITFSVRGIHWGILGGAVLATIGAITWVRSNGKSGVTAATVLLTAGLIQIWLLK